VLLVALPTLAEAGPPLICHPFQTLHADLLAWGAGPGWNTPDQRYDVQRLTTDTLRLLARDAPVLSRMENMRRAAIYATRNRQVAEELLAAVLARASAPGASRLAIFDAGYLIETYKQAAHLFGGAVTNRDGYSMVLRAIELSPQAAEMEFAAALMTSGAASTTHLQRARAGTAAESLLAKNITNLGW
jgi:hypothetical protein